MKTLFMTAALLGLAGCAADGDSSASTSSSSASTPSSVAGNVSSVEYQTGADTLTFVLSGLDVPSTTTVYQRNTALDVGDYAAYTTQDDPLDRHFTALRRSSADGDLMAIAVADGGQFNRYFGGTQYIRSGNYTPDTGLASYAGTYAGVTNVGDASGDDLLTTPPGTDASTAPSQSARVSGNVFLNVDFGENAVNGSVYDRVLIRDASDATQNLDLPSVVMVLGSIDSLGEFTGTVEYDADNATAGTYAGVFGGTNASSVAGLLYLSQFDGTGNPLGFENEEEYGVFVISQCGSTNASSLCD